MWSKLSPVIELVQQWTNCEKYYFEKNKTSPNQQKVNQWQLLSKSPDLPRVFGSLK